MNGVKTKIILQTIPNTILVNYCIKKKMHFEVI